MTASTSIAQKLFTGIGFAYVTIWSLYFTVRVAQLVSQSLHQNDPTIFSFNGFEFDGFTFQRNVSFLSKFVLSVSSIDVYRWIVLFAEFFGSLSVVLQVFLRMRKPWASSEFIHQADGTKASWLSSNSPVQASSKSPYTSPVEDLKSAKKSRRRRLSAVARIAASTGQSSHLRVLIPCYTEDLEIVKETALAALKMKFDGLLDVYICDDGSDSMKDEWVTKMNHKNLHYVCRPLQFKGHAKAGNINYCLKHVVYTEETIKTLDLNREFIAVFDADMIPSPDFARALLPYFQADKSVALVQTPQTFHNLSPVADVFDAHNLFFYQYLQPAFSEWNTTMCCGSNFVVQAQALRDCGWFPTTSVTEDMLLGIKLQETGLKVKYHAENLASGEAPEELKQIFQQRRRWTTGAFQIALKSNPLYSKKLNLVQKLVVGSTFVSYLSSALLNPIFLCSNVISLLFGVHPISIDRPIPAVTVLFFLYGIMQQLVMFATPNSKHLKSLWVCSKMGYFFSFLYLEAIMEVFFHELIWRNDIAFKVTKKRKSVTNLMHLTDEAVSKANVFMNQYKDILFHLIVVSILVLSAMASVVLGGMHRLWVIAQTLQYISGLSLPLLCVLFSKCPKSLERNLNRMILLDFIAGISVPLLRNL